MQLFLAVVRMGTLGAAARALRLSHPTIGGRIPAFRPLEAIGRVEFHVLARTRTRRSGSTAIAAKDRHLPAGLAPGMVGRIRIATNSDVRGTVRRIHRVEKAGWHDGLAEAARRWSRDAFAVPDLSDVAQFRGRLEDATDPAMPVGGG